MPEDAFYIRRMWSFSRALDLSLVDEEIERGLQVALGQRHGERVAYIAMRLGRNLGLNKKDLVHLTLAGLLHDIGALGCFRTHYGNSKILNKHCLVGSAIVERFPSGAILAPAIKYHHETPSPTRSALRVPADEVPLMARILSLADQVDLRLPRRRHTRQERDEMLQWITRENGILFYPEVTVAFEQVAEKEAFWLDIEQSDLLQIALELLFGKWHLPSVRELETGFTDELAATFADLIDQKSQFTARHSRSVAETVEHLASGLGWDEKQRHEIYVAGLLHDLGKLSIPKKILDKQGPLDASEVEVIRTHTYYTHRLLTEAGFPTQMVEWAAHHHERLDGRGYPFALTGKDVDVGARLMTIADMFAALTEDRPYRRAMSAGEALDIIQRGVGISVDAELVNLARQRLV
ncbi:HD domain-containing phosphohydrolase [Desulfosporosinus sp. SB140]|uniref:HD domain-containing phosphohydrolase n=1 Tax=Desulfosporosinus paludis TaxID=3115649 RepID=UPI0038901FCA